MGKRRRNKALMFGGVIVVGGTTWLAGTAGADGPPPPPTVASESLMVPSPGSGALDAGDRSLIVASVGAAPASTATATTNPGGSAPTGTPVGPTPDATGAPGSSATTATTATTVPVPVPAAVPLAAPLHLLQPVAILGVVAENLAIGRTAAIEVVLTARPDGASVIAGSTPHYAPEPPPTTAAPAAHSEPSDASLAALRECEASGNYGAVSWGGLYRGAYQFDQSTWDSVTSRWYPHLVGVDPATVSPAEQDAVARALYAERGWQPWPTCGRYL